MLSHAIPGCLAEPPEASPDRNRAEQVRRIVDQAPPFTEEQRRKLRPILAGGLDAHSQLAATA